MVTKTKVFYSLSILTFALIIVSCSKNDNPLNFDNQPNIGIRATSLGFENVEAYQDSVSVQCAAGNHENCDILSDGTHEVCASLEHTGVNHDGTIHNGTDHGIHNADSLNHNGNNHNNDGHNNGKNHN